MKEQVLQAALAAAQAIKDEGARAEALTSLAPQLTGELKEQALEAALPARGIKDERYRAEVLTSLAPQLTGELKEQVLQAALAAAQAIEDEG